MVVLVIGDGEGDDDLPAFRVLGVAQHCFDHIAHLRSFPLLRTGGAVFSLWSILNSLLSQRLDESIIIRSRPASGVPLIKYFIVISLSAFPGGNGRPLRKTAL